MGPYPTAIIEMARIGGQDNETYLIQGRATGRNQVAIAILFEAARQRNQCSLRMSNIETSTAATRSSLTNTNKGGTLIPKIRALRKIGSHTQRFRRVLISCLRHLLPQVGHRAQAQARHRRPTPRFPSIRVPAMSR